MIRNLGGNPRVWISKKIAILFAKDTRLNFVSEQ
jgi:hypothetical protein